MVQYQSGDAFVKIVYAKIQSNGKTEMVPLKLYVDGSLEHITRNLFTGSESGVASQSVLGNRYSIQRVLGQGGFGRTYLATDRHRFEELCVVKEFLPQTVGEDEAQKSRDLFEREAKILHQIDHPQIPKFFACFEDEGRLFLVQEYVKGRTYASLLRERQQHGQTFSEVEVMQWLKDLLPVLDYIHDRNIIHRDISPDNVMLQQDQNLPMLIDFGVGRWTIEQLRVEDEQHPYTRKHSVVGKVGYAPHEQLWMGHAFPSSDLYSLAVTAIVLLTGKNPQDLMDSRTLTWKWRNFTQVSDRFAQILNTMLSDNPSQRYATATAVLEALDGKETTIVSQSPVTQVSQPAPAFHSTPRQPVSPPIQNSGQPSVNPSRSQSVIREQLIEQCEQELMQCIGPVATFLVQEVVSNGSVNSSEELINAIVKRIPNHAQAVEFQRKLLRLSI